MSEYPTRKLENIVERVCVGYVGSCNNDYTESGVGVPMVRTTNLTGTAIDYEQMKFISNEFHKKNVKSQLKKGDILVARHGDSGLPSIYESDEEANCLNVVIVKPTANDDLIDNYYILYALKSPFVVHQIKAAVGGSVQGVVNTKVIAGLDIPFPERSIREKIVRHIFNIDKKIELNRQTNQTLEQIAQAIFKSWFVDFEPVKAKIAAKQNGQNPELAAMCAISGKTEEQLKDLNEAALQQLKTTAALFPDALVESELGEIPEGWGVSEMSELLEFNPKRTLKKGTLAPYLDMKNIPTQGHLADDVYLREMASGTKFINGDTLLARITPCLENGKTAYVDFLEEEQVGWGSTEYIIMRPKNGRPMSLGYMIARLDSFRAKAIQTMTGTSGRQRANAKALAEQSWIDYPTSLLKVYDLVAGSYLVKAKINGDVNKILSELRDILLPKLLSGELSVESTQKEFEVAV